MSDQSHGPPLPPGRSDRLWVGFADEIIEAQGEWVEMDTDNRHGGNTRHAVLTVIGNRYAEVTTRLLPDGRRMIYGRLKAAVGTPNE